MYLLRASIFMREYLKKLIQILVNTCTGITFLISATDIKIKYMQRNKASNFFAACSHFDKYFRDL